MALSSITFVANGRGPYAIHALDYLSTTHLSVTVNGVPATATFDDARKEMTLAATPVAGQSVIVRRTTPRLQEQRLTQFLTLPSGSAGLSAALLDQDYRQLMLAAGEGRDAADVFAGLSGLGLGTDTQWDARSKKIINLAVGASPGDAVAKSQLDAFAAAARPLPTVTGADNDDGLFVTTGEFAKRTPTQARTHLGLGTEAVLVAGTGANNAAQFDANARYPAADGRNIDLTNHAIQTTINQRALATVVRVIRTAFPGNSLDVALNTWSQNSASRLLFNGASWTARVELNNSSDVDGSVAANGVVLSAGTWRIKWALKSRQTAGAGGNYSFRITNNDDTSAQTVYLDYGVLRNPRQFNGGQTYYIMYQDSLVMASATPFAIVFRAGMATSAANNDTDLAVLFHKISTTLLT